MSELFETLEKILGAGERFGVQHLVEPLLEDVNPEAARYLSRRRETGRSVYGTDVMEALFPGGGEDPWTKRWGKAAGGFLLGAAVDPTTYLAPGLTKAGKLAKLAPAARKAGILPVKALEMLPEASLSRIAAKKGMSQESVLQLMRGVAGKKPGTPFEDSLVDLFWSEAPAMPERLGAQFKQGLATVLRFEVPFTKLELDLKTGLQRAHLESIANLVDYPIGTVLSGARTFGRKVGAMGAVGRGVTNMVGLMDRTFGTSILHRPALVEATRRLHEGIWSLRGRSADEVAERWAAQHARLIDRVAAELEIPVKEARGKLNEVMRKTIEGTMWDPTRGLRRSVSMVMFDDSGRALLGKLKDPSVDRLLEDAVHSLAPTAPQLGGPASLVDDDLARSIREQVVKAHELHHAVIEREWKSGLMTPALWGSGGYMLHALSSDARGVLGPMLQRLTKYGHRDLRRLALPGFFSDLTRKMRVLVPQALEDLRPRLLEMPLSPTRPKGPKLWSEKILEGIKSGKMQTDEEFATDVYKRIKKSVELTEKSKGKWGLTLEDVRGLVHNMSVDEVNQYVYRFGLKGKKGELLIEPGKMKNFFNDDPVDMLYQRVASGNAHVVRHEYVKAIRPLGLKVTGVVPEGYSTVEGVGALKGLAFPTSEAKFISNTFGAYRNVYHAMDEFMKWYDVPLRAWKAGTLTIFPAYHFRNFLGNLWNNWLGGVGTKDNLDAFRVMRVMGKRQWKETVAKNSVTGEVVTVKDLWDAGLSRNLFGTGEIIAESLDGTFASYMNHAIRRVRNAQTRAAGGKVRVKEMLQESILPDNEKVGLLHALGFNPDAKGWDVISPESSPFIRTGLTVANGMENYSKVAHVISRVKKGDTLDQAITSAKKHLFDYRMLTDAERRGFRRIFPFYAWSRNNIPLQLTYLVKRPYRAASLQRTERAIQQGTGVYGTPEPPLISEWFRKAQAIRYRKGKDGRDYFVTPVGTIPHYDLAEAMDLWSWAKFNMAPLPSRLIEQFFNTDLMTKRQVDLLVDRVTEFDGLLPKYITKGERRKLFGVSIPRRIHHDIRNTSRLIRYLEDTITNPEKLDWTARAARLILMRDYPYNIDRSRASFVKALTDLESNYRKAAKSAASYKDMKEVQRVQEKYGQAVQNLVSTWTGGME